MHFNNHINLENVIVALWKVETVPTIISNKSYRTVFWIRIISNKSFRTVFWTTVFWWLIYASFILCKECKMNFIQVYCQILCLVVLLNSICSDLSIKIQENVFAAEYTISKKFHLEMLSKSSKVFLDRVNNLKCQ
jgi:hypothetical protein